MRLIPLLIATVGAFVAHTGQVSVDETRRSMEVEDAFRVKPSPGALRVASMGYDVHVADIMWVRSVLTFGKYWTETGDPRWQEWLGGMIDTVTELDPEWRTVYTYGGLMLKVLGAYEASNRVFAKGAEAFPEDHFLPFSIGMTHLLHLNDLEEAYRWVSDASERESAPEWYRGAAIAIYAKESSRSVGIRFLVDQLRETSDPNLRDSIKRHLDELVHAERSEKLNAALALYRERFGSSPESIETLAEVGAIESIPADPYERGWVLDPDGNIYSRVVAEDRAARAVRFERSMLRDLSTTAPSQ